MATVSSKIINNEKLKKIVYDEMDMYTLMLANSWTSGTFQPYHNSMRDDVYNWLKNNVGSEKYKYITAAYGLKEDASAQEISSELLESKFGSLIALDIKSLNLPVVIREDLSGKMYAVYSKINKVLIKEFIENQNQ